MASLNIVVELGFYGGDEQSRWRRILTQMVVEGSYLGDGPAMKRVGEMMELGGER